MKIQFYKYQATGNDFVLIDNRDAKFTFTTDQVKKICHRKFGVGSDGLMLIENHPDCDFNLVYYNSDGSQSLCGNGSRAAVHLAAFLNILDGKTTFNAYDGKHDAEVMPSDTVRLRMNDVISIQSQGNDYFLNTGSPHHIRIVNNLKEYPVVEEGRKIRYSAEYLPEGTNVNFIELLPQNTIYVRTYERGVEDETLSCGTGVTAAALAASLKGYTSPVTIKTLGGDLSVEFKTGQTAQMGASTSQPGMFQEIFLVGPAKMVFKGELEL